MVCTRCAIEKLLEEKGKTNKKAPVHEHTGPCGLVVEKALRRDGWGAGQPILQLKPHPHARQRWLSSTLPKAAPTAQPAAAPTMDPRTAPAMAPMLAPPGPATKPRVAPNSAPSLAAPAMRAVPAAAPASVPMALPSLRAR